MTFTVTVDPANAFQYNLDQYKGLLSSDIAEALKAGADMVSATARMNMTANGNVDRGYLRQSVGTLDMEQDDSHVLITVGASRATYPGRWKSDKSFNDISAFLEFGTGGGKTWSWKGPEGSRWAGWHFGWQGSLPHPFLIPALDAMTSSVLTLVREAVGRRW
jgi:hypothetical protein